MCGISGLSLQEGTVNNKTLVKNNSLMKHRGPDGSGTWISKDKKTGFSHVRLSIVDLDPRSNQPFEIDDRYVITFNGEIYNYLSLKKKLSKKYSFTTTSDTEVLLYMYKEHKEKMMQYLEGMFAFCIYDKKTKELFLARDIIGQKPLVYHEGNEGFYFASEIPVIHSMKPSTKKNLDYTALRIYESDKFSHIPQPFTAYKEIKKLKPAHYLLVKEGQIKTYKQYFRLTKKKFSKINDVKLIRGTIENMKPTDVQYASFLSGGIDSSLICSILQEHNDTPVEGYTLTTKKEDPDYKRSKIAANIIGLTHYKITYEPEKLQKNKQELEKILGEPYFHITTIYTDQILAHVKKKHKVIFTGAGGDELYYGYNNKILLLVDFVLFLNKLLPKQVMKLILPKKYKYLAGTTLKNIKKQIYLESYKKVKSHPNQEDLGEQYIQELIDDLFSYADITNYVDLSYISGLIIENSHSLTIPGDLAGMRHSIEIRNPFLEKKLLERAYSIPLWKKTKITKLKEGKEILRKALLEKFPKSFVYAKKYGFGTELTGETHERSNTTIKKNR